MVLWTLLLLPIKSKQKTPNKLDKTLLKKGSNNILLFGKKTNTRCSFSVGNRMQSWDTIKPTKCPSLTSAFWSHPCAPQAFQSSQNCFFHGYPNRRYCYLLISKTFWQSVRSMLQCALGNTLSSFGSLKMHFNGLVIKIFSVFYTKALKLTIYLVTFVNEIWELLYLGYVFQVSIADLSEFSCYSGLIEWTDLHNPVPAPKPKPSRQWDLYELVPKL